jgi:predicted MFS family arabinose efflux permease
MWADAVVFIAAGGLLAMFFFMTLYLQEVLELSALETGLAFLPFSATMGVVSAGVGRLPDRIDARLPIAAGLVVGAVGLYLMSTLGVASSYAGAVLPALIVTAAGLALAFVPVMGLATGDAEERDGGLASGLMTSAQQIGGAIGIAVMTTIATSHTSYAAAGGASQASSLVEGFQAAFQVEAAVMLAAALLAVLALRRRD